MTQKPTYEELEQRVEALERENASLTKEKERAVNFTDRNLAEEALRESEKRYRRILQTAIDGFWLIDLDGRLLDVNDAYCTMTGYTEEELLSMSISDLEALESHEEVSAHIEKIMDQSGDRFETQHRRKDGSILDVEVSVQFQPEGRGLFFVFVRDITERKQVEEEQKNLQAQLVNAMEMAHLGPWEYDVANDLFMFNDHFYKIFRTTAEEVGGYTMSSEEYARRFLHPDDIPLVGEEVRKAIEATDPNFSRQLEHRILYADGTVGWITVRFNIIKDENGQTVRTYGANQDITERKQAEIEREKLQAQLSNALEIANLAPWEYNVAEDLFTLNDHFYKLFRTTADEVGGYTMSSGEFARRFFHPDEVPAFEERLHESGEERDPDLRQRSEHRIIYGDGTPGYISVIPSDVKDSQGKTVHIYGVNQDVTEQKRMEEELLRTQKLESVGILAGGIAHDFNNILTTILGSIALAKMEVGPKDEIFPLLSDVETASSRAQALTKQLLTFAKGGAPIKETSSVKEVITESSIFVLRGSKSSCEFSIAEDLWSVEVDVGQISQVINNVVMNANQAMPDGGRIQVAGENLTIEDTHGLPIKPGRYVRISIRDQGLGIAKENIEKVFDPYFTTRHEGNGLGLATTYSIVKNHDGHITVESELGKGSTFQIYLPASEKTVQEMAEDRVIPGTGKILIMDDEPFVRKTLGRILEKLGYEPEFAQEGAEAIEMYKTAEESGKPYEAVILDLTIPGGMGGKETIKKLVEIKSGAKAIVSSGYSDDSLLANFQEYGFRGILPKPFNPQTVSKVLNEVIQGKAGP